MGALHEIDDAPELLVTIACCDRTKGHSVLEDSGNRFLCSLVGQDGMCHAHGNDSILY